LGLHVHDIIYFLVVCYDLITGSSSSSPGLAPVLDLPLPLAPLQVTPAMPMLKPFDADDNVGENDGSTTRSLCIPILDLCITEDEGYLGMGEDKSEGSENDLTTSQGKPSSKRQSGSEKF